jgi:8-oxo-dGTP diphosphatase
VTCGCPRPDGQTGRVTHATARIPCVGAVVHDDGGRILLVRRAHPPGAGLWSIPGGKVEPGEDDATAVAREVAEETGLRVEPGAALGSVERPAPGGGVFVIADLVCRVTGGTLAAGDDAADAGWFTAAELATLPLVPGLVEALTTWQVLPR